MSMMMNLTKYVSAVNHGLLCVVFNERRLLLMTLLPLNNDENGNGDVE